MHVESRQKPSCFRVRLYFDQGIKQDLQKRNWFLDDCSSSDSTARIWELSSKLLPDMQSQVSPKVLHHGDGPHKDVTTLEWSVSSAV